ncbi:MAG: PadR family transcriptional regulator [Ferrimicrobium sp.]
MTKIVEKSSGSVLELALLGFLSTEPLHGYELNRRIEQVFGTLLHVSWGALYPALSRLEHQGLLATSPEKQKTSTHQLTGSLAGELALVQVVANRRSGMRARKVYRITAQGTSALRERIHSLDLEDDRSFWLGCAFSEGVGSTTLPELLKLRCHVLTSRREELQRANSASTPAIETVIAGLNERLEHEIAWCKRTLEDYAATSANAAQL